jgi:hypothetical protein
MTKLEFQDLCRESSRLLQLADVEQLASSGRIELGGHAIGAFYDADEDDAIHCFVDLGLAPQQDRMHTLERLLALNLELGRMHGESLGLDEQSGHIVLRSEITNLALCTPERLAEWLLDYAGFADQFGDLLNECQSLGAWPGAGSQLA